MPITPNVRDSSDESDAEEDDDGLECPADRKHIMSSRGIAKSNPKTPQLSGVRASLADSGSSDHIVDAMYNSYLKSSRTSNSAYETAGAGCIRGELEGELEITILNLDRQPDCPDLTDHEITVTTVRGLGHEPLFSLEDEFTRHGYDSHMCHGYKAGDRTGLYRPPEGHAHGPESFIPMSHNYQGRGGWRVLFMIRNPGISLEAHRAMCRQTLEAERERVSRRARVVRTGNSSKLRFHLTN